VADPECSVIAVSWFATDGKSIGFSVTGTFATDVGGAEGADGFFWTTTIVSASTAAAHIPSRKFFIGFEEFLEVGLRDDCKRAITQKQTGTEFPRCQLQVFD
jgi:hypothetical protein